MTRIFSEYLNKDRDSLGRVCGACKSSFSGMCGASRAFFDRICAACRAFYSRMWAIFLGNSSFSFEFEFDPEDGGGPRKKSLGNHRLRNVLFAAATCLLVIFGSLMLAFHTVRSTSAQYEELMLYRSTMQGYAAKQKELLGIVEKNQNDLAKLEKMEKQMRRQLEKLGIPVPLMSPIHTGGQGGPLEGENVSQLDILIAQGKNLQQAVTAEKNTIEALRKSINDEEYRREVTPSVWPTDSDEITSSFGGRISPFNGYRIDWHPGIDIANTYGAPIYASASGHVAMAGWYGGYGRYVEIEHDFGYVTAYGHMSVIAVSAGQYVEKGSVIGYVGNSGYSTGPHLHFEVIRNGKQVNPFSVIKRY